MFELLYMKSSLCIQLNTNIINLFIVEGGYERLQKFCDGKSEKLVLLTGDEMFAYASYRKVLWILLNNSCNLLN